ncbi:MAG: peptide chain release factor N(5)-glutamine methyltransferase [Eubacteriales bacterium]|nr:peptide chain release factor N(5)-glutamine methyltransferase [Eubacteriales bacterium]
MVDSTIKALLADAVKKMEFRQYNNPYLDAQLLLAHVIRKDRTFVMVHTDYALDDYEVATYYDLIEKRNTGYPIQYILNRQEFMGLDFYISDGVLIPRPDTENIVEAVIRIHKEAFADIDEVRILDIGAGSGAIGCSLAHFIPKSKVIGIDVSDIAVRVAAINKERLGLSNYEIHKMNVFDDIFLELNGFHIVVSNPPYIPADDIDELQKEVSEFEPRIALNGGIDGLDYYNRIIRVFRKFAADRAILALECGWNQKDSIELIMNQSVGFDRIETIKDLSGNNRGLIGFYSKN